MGRGLHTVLVRRRAPPPSLVRALLRHAGVGSPCGCGPRGSRRLGALGRAMCRSSRTPPPPRRGPFWGRGDVPSAPGGAEGCSCGSQARGGERGGGGRGGRPPAPLPLSGVGLPSVVPGVPPGVDSCRGGCWAAAGVRRGPVGRQRVSAAGGGGGGGGEPTRPGSRPPLPRLTDKVARAGPLSQNEIKR